MPEQKERPRPHGDPLQREIVEPNPGQQQTDATDDVVADQQAGIEERADAVQSTANGVPEGDEDEGAIRRKLYKEGATPVSRID